MTISFAEVKVGDRVRLTAENGDEATFTVVDLHTNSYGVYAEFNFYSVHGKWDTLEILPKLLPTEPGLYVRSDADLDNDPIYQRLTVGSWNTDDGGTWKWIDEQDIPSDLVRLVKESDRD